MAAKKTSRTSARKRAGNSPRKASLHRKSTTKRNSGARTTKTVKRVTPRKTVRKAISKATRKATRKAVAPRKTAKRPTKKPTKTTTLAKSSVARVRRVATDLVEQVTQAADQAAAAVTGFVAERF